MQLNGIIETCVYVDDLNAAEAFYSSVLGLKVVGRQASRHVFFRCGDHMLLVFDPRESGKTDSDLPPHGASGPGHIAFAVPDNELDPWKERLVAAAVEIEQEVEWPDGGRSFYFRDPAGNSLELATPTIWGIGEGKMRREGDGERER